MPHYNLALAGFGNVGRALAGLLQRKEAEIHQRYGITYRITAIATGRHGSAVDPDGIDIRTALELAAQGGSLQVLSNQPVADPQDFIARCGADVFFENTPVNYATGEPASTYLRMALEMGMHAITANKGPVVHAYQDLKKIARASGVKFRFESTVMDGAPIFSLFRETLPAATLNGFQGILNSTTNLILTAMENGETFEAALAQAQAHGVAETDPSGDVDGWDAAIKISALATVLMGIPLTPQEVERRGIGELGPADMQHARQRGMRWKLVCSARRQAGGLQARVRPEMVGPESPFYGVQGTGAILVLESDVLGPLSIREDQPIDITTPETTAYGLLADFIAAVRS